MGKQQAEGSLHIEMSEADRGQYQRLYVSEADLGEARGYASHILKKGWHSPSFMRLQSVPMHQDAFTTSLIIAYARGCKPSRRPIFPPAGVLDHSAEEASLHDKIVRLRDKVVAHSDAEMFSVKPWSTDQFQTHVTGFPYPHFKKHELELFLTMVAQTRSRMLSIRREILGRYVPAERIDNLLRT
jgi:hypothetical protein